MLQDPAIRNPIAISLGAIGGALSRYYLTLLFARWFGTEFPYGTFFINLTGCLLMGWFATLTLEQPSPLPLEVRLMATVGFLGAYTTFSTYGLDTINLLRSSNLTIAGLYWLGSAALGILCVQLGVILGRWGKG